MHTFRTIFLDTTHVQFHNDRAKAAGGGEVRSQSINFVDTLVVLELEKV